VDLVYAYNEFNHHLHVFLKVVDIHEQKMREKQDLQQINMDAQTGLLNHDSFDRELMLTLASPSARQQPDAVLCVAVVGLYDSGTAEDSDWDRFRENYIVRAVRTMKAWIRSNEILGRYSADEFALLLCGEGEAAQQAERLRVLFTTLQLSLEEYSDFFICIGYYTCLNANASANRIMRKAHRALYWAREQGSSALVPYSLELDVNLRNPSWIGTKSSREDFVNKADAIPVSEAGVFIRTFGHFDVFVNGQAVLFTNAKSKELLALLVDRGGGYLSASEAIACLWESEPTNDATLARYRKAAMYLKNTLKAYQADDILCVIKGKRRINKDKFQCDYYLCADSGPSIVQYFPSSYMVEYSWAENTISILEAMRQKEMSKQKYMIAR
jgi:diguanylate cyclase (GGDEF)-like protein